MPEVPRSLVLCSAVLSWTPRMQPSASSARCSASWRSWRATSAAAAALWAGESACDRETNVAAKI